MEVGAGLADALGLRPGARLATLSPAGNELRLKVVGIVRALDYNGRIGWVSAGTLERAQPGLTGQTVIRLEPGADRSGSTRACARSTCGRCASAAPRRATRASSGSSPAVLRAVALLVGLVCLYALLQGLAMTARERRGALAVLRACGASTGDVARVLGGAAAAVALPAAVLAVVLELVVLGPLVTRLAAGYAGLPLSPRCSRCSRSPAAWRCWPRAAASAVARRLVREPVVLGLREELP